MISLIESALPQAPSIIMSSGGLFVCLFFEYISRSEAFVLSLVF